MKKPLNLAMSTLLLVLIMIIGCKKDESKTTNTTTSTTSTTNTTTSASYFGVGTVKHNADAIIYSLQGDSTAYMIIAGSAQADDSSFMFIKGYGSNGIGTPMTTGTYTVVDICDTCSHTLLPFEALVFVGTPEGGGSASSGTLDVVVNSGKPTITFSNITLTQTTLKAFGKIIVP